MPAPNAVRRRDRQAAAVGRHAQQIEADIGEPGAPSLIAAKVLAELGTVDILAYNAATVEPAELPRPPGSVREFLIFRTDRGACLSNAVCGATAKQPFEVFPYGPQARRCAATPGNS